MSFPYEVSVTPAVEDGRLIATEVVIRRTAGGPPVTGESLRSLPIARLTREAAADSHLAAAPTLAAPELAKYEQQMPAGDFGALVRGLGPRPNVLDFVAYVYRDALLTGAPPTKTIQDRLGVPRSTVGRWVALARQAGYLGEAQGQGRVAA